MGLFDFISKQRDIGILKKEIRDLKKNNKKKIQALIEGNHSNTDILSTGATGTTSISSEASQKKSMYKTYQAITQMIHDMFNAKKDFGGEFIKSILRTRVAFIAGGGITVISKNGKTSKWITDFFEHNKMKEGSNLFKNVLRTEMDGKVLLVIKPDKKKEMIDIRSFSHIKSPYIVTMEEKDNQIIKEVTYKSENTDLVGEQVAKTERLVYIMTGGDPDDINEPVPTIGNCLTDIENASRIKYDLRYNNHLFGRLTPSFQTNDMVEAKALNNLLIATNWKIGRTYVGTALLNLVGPPSEAAEALIKELIMACRILSINTGIPIHWLSYPELMSNRSTSENMMEVINSATIMEREVWEEGLTELVKKAMNYAVELGFSGAKEAIKGIDDFEIRLPLISEAKIKEIQETWIPLADGGYITQDSVRNKIPGINPLFEKNMLEQEKKDNMKKINDRFNKVTEEHEDEEEEDVNQEE